MTAVPAIHNRHGERIDHTYHAGRDGRRGIVVLGHGVTGNKDRPFAVALGEALAAAGVCALRISFSGNGASEGRFVDSTVTKEVDDLGAVLDVLAGAGWEPVAYVGHSMGAAVGVLRARGDPRIRVLVSLAGMVHTAEFAERKFGALTPGADVMWDKPECPLSQAFVDDMREVSSVVAHAGSIEVPWLLVHGTDDTVVPLSDSHDIVAAARADGGSAEPELIELRSADHVFSGDAMPRMVEAVMPFLDEKLAAADG